MDEVNALPASEHETYQGELCNTDITQEDKVLISEKLKEDDDESSESTHSTSGVVSASSPGSQRDFYNHVSGAGDGSPLQTSEGTRPTNLPLDIKMDNGTIVGPVVVRSSMSEFEENNRNGVSLRDVSKDWSNQIQRFNRTINAVLKNIPDPNKVDVSTGKKAIHRDKPVVLAWSKNQQKLKESIDSGLASPPGDADIKFTETQDGVVLYCAIRLREEFYNSNDNETSAIRDVFRQTCLTPDQGIPNINLDSFDLGEKFKARFKASDAKRGDGKSPRSRKSPRRSPTKGSPRKSSSNGDERDSEGRQLRGGDDENEDTYSTSSDFDDDTEIDSEEYKHRRGVGISDDDDYRIMRSRAPEGREGSPKKSVRWRKEVDRKDGSGDRAGSSTKKGAREEGGSRSRDSSATTSPRRKGSSDSKKSDDDSPKGGSRRSSTSPRRRGSSESKGTDDDSPKSGSRRSSSEQSPRDKSAHSSKRSSKESVGLDQTDYDREGSNGHDYDIGKGSDVDSNEKQQGGARSRSVKRDDDNTERRRYRRDHGSGRPTTDSSYDGSSLGDERKRYLNLDGSTTSNEKDRLIRRRRTALRTRRRRAEQLKAGEPFDAEMSEIEGDAGQGRPRTAKEKHRLNELRRKYLNPDLDEMEDKDFKDHDPEYDRNEDQRHDTCFLPFEGYDENYDGPVGVLTSKLPDGSSTAGTLFTTIDIRHRKSSLPFLDFYDLQLLVSGIDDKKRYLNTLVGGVTRRILSD